MLNILWGAMMLIGITYGAMTGRMGEITDAALSSAKEAVVLCITMAGIVAMWMGVMEIARSSGMIEKMTEKMQPLLRFLFPNLPKDHPAMEYISANIIANFLGLGWGATPFGLKAMEKLAELEDERRLGQVADRNSGKKLHILPRGTASNEMCTFLILNISSLQLIPVNIIAYRSQYGSTNPAGIVGPGIVATLISTVVAIAFCKLKDRKRRG
ncbi:MULTISPECIES: nucleoside recognition protein [Blautia]|uniref:nucleoside recognition protein n=1 Tax=Blautia TaxID=572511 RepID=UPI000BA33D57|nr:MULTISPECIES: nucleoside recognition protein [Blautia]